MTQTQRSWWARADGVPPNHTMAVLLFAVTGCMVALVVIAVIAGKARFFWPSIAGSAIIPVAAVARARPRRPHEDGDGGGGHHGRGDQ